MRSLPSRRTSIGIGTLPARKPGTLVRSARSAPACSTACLISALGTSTVRRTRSSASSTRFVSTSRIQAERAPAPSDPSARRPEDSSGEQFEALAVRQLQVAAGFDLVGQEVLGTARAARTELLAGAGAQ